MSQYMLLPTNKDLLHHGRLGQKWGTRNGPPYPLNADGLRKFREHRKAKKAAKKEKIERKRQERENKVVAKYQANKNKVLMGGTAAQVMQYQGQWTNQELKQIVDRLDYEEKITARIPKKRTTKDKMNNLVDSVKDITNYSNKGADLWNMIARFYNSSGAGKDNPMHYILDKGKYQEKDKSDNTPKQEPKIEQDIEKKKKSNSNYNPKKDPKNKAYWEWDY